MEGRTGTDHSTHSQACRCVEGDHKTDSFMTNIVHDIVQVLLLHMRTADGGKESDSRTRLRTALDQLDMALNDIVKPTDEKSNHASD